MKSLLFILLISTPLYAQEMADDNALKNKFVAGVKDAEIEGMLERTKEFTDCFKDSKYQYDKADSESERNVKIALAEKCFNDKVTKGKSPEQLKELSDKLNLESYGLVKSKNVNDITSYLTDKMYKAMTGFSRQEKNEKDLIESMKFKNRKMIDQSVFIKLYKTQLSKSALQEMTRYCFEDFRQDGKKGANFDEYWNSTGNGVYKDNGDPEFKADPDSSDSKKTHVSIIKSIAEKPIDSNFLDLFFKNCMAQMKNLCEEYEKNISGNSPAKYGGKSCLVKAKLQEIRKALAQTEEVIKQFNNIDGKGVALLLDQNQMAQMYDPTKDPKNSLDKLTITTSQDVLEGNSDEAITKIAEKCQDSKSSSDEECEKFFIESDSHNKAVYDIQMQMNLKKEVEIARIKELLKNKDKKLNEYLTENGYFELAKKLENNTLADGELEKDIKNIFNARKEAAVEEFRKKVGNRQASEDELKNGKKSKASVTQTNAEATFSERTRLAQVVLFNNIIMGSINLEDKDGKVLGKNISGLEQEVGQLGNIPGLQSNFFEGLKGDVDKAGSNSAIDNSVLGATDLIDSILGKEKK